MTIIQYYIKSIYGVERMYISDPTVAESVSLLTGQRTLSWVHIAALERLGFKFEQILSPATRPTLGRTLVSPVNSPISQLNP